MKKQYLREGWSLNGARLSDAVTATVPGCVHTDLIAAGVLGDLFWRDNNRQAQWIENEEWDYCCTFDATPDKDAALIFEGLDTYAEITLNGVCLGKTDNMFLEHRFDVSGMLRESKNELRVHFFSPVRMVEDKPKCKGAFTTERMYTRRIQCTYGWDWVDRFVSCGIWRPVYLAYDNGIDVEDVYVYTEHLDAFSAQIYTEINFTRYETGAVAQIEILDPDGASVASSAFFADCPKMIRRFDLAEPRLWFPNGYGEQPLYRLIVTVGDNRFEQSFGVRTLKIMQLPDAKGSEYFERAQAAQETEAGKKYSKNESFSGFQVVVNGVKIFCQGGNWVPCEPFPSAESDEKISYLVKMAKEMGANFLRVWGGGIFERASFYDACDREGILVAQDFLMACGHYPEKEAWFIDALTRESEYAAKYLRNHPCLAWWHGDNENATRGSDTQEDYTGRDSGLKGIAPQIYRYDFSRPFLPSSPYGGDSYASLSCGTAHTTNHVPRMLEYFHTEDCSDYQEYFEQFVARFISEDTTLGAISRPSLLRFMTEDDILRDESEEMWIYHTKGNPGLPREIFLDMRAFAAKLLGEFRDGEDKYFKYKYLQYEWMRQHFENARAALGYCNGDIYWMLDDCWPAAAGWSLVDYYGLPKSGFYSFKRCAAPVMGAIRAQGLTLRLTVSNITAHAQRVSISARRLDGASAYAETEAFLTTVLVKPYATESVALPWEEKEDEAVVCDIVCDTGRDRCFHKRGILPLTPCDGALSVVERTESTVTLHADSYVHAVELEGQYVFEDNYFSMLAGERKTVKYRAADDREKNELTVTAYTLDLKK